MFLMVVGGIGSFIFVSPHIMESLPLVMNFVCSGTASAAVLFYCFHRRKKKDR
jgi:hypothetical protein